ncbi:ADP-ribosylglycohydrolase family protein [Nakamurella sp. YIM 132087]|uniref:ADP-ribosylglycohydrolase family protein n=1 Tax=Nakamurella alba TaxID=2665158 RepID=A0A7K1FRR5_9ACTN|nr:ADP-ribosylglycohydrolase family protein [Nakamurella alba]MTD15504.1 ADP-ribosylglycohydrolase family protein [Nakamurella alba]
MRRTTAQQDRAAGTLLGMAAGDALGAGYEFTHPTPDQVIDMIGGGIGNFEPGEWTDDTSMAVAIALVTAEGIDVRTDAGLDAVAANFVRWFDDGPKDFGVMTGQVLRQRPASAQAMSLAASAIPGRHGGNGSLMRTAPIGLAFPGDPAATAEAALRVSALTHDDNRAGEACQIWSLLIEDAVRTGELDREWRVLQHLDSSVADHWLPLKKQAETGEPQQFPDNGWVVHALQTAWWAITTTDDLPRGIKAAVRAGHDTDTTAAIAGALLGATYGAASIPDRWREMLHGWPGLRAEDLVRLAHRTGVSGSA